VRENRTHGSEGGESSSSSLPLSNLSALLQLDYRSGQIMFEAVTPAKAGVQVVSTQKYWIPAFTGMTAISNFTWPGQ